MISNERQYKITKASADKFKSALDSFDELAALEKGIDPIIIKAQRDSLASQHEELLRQLAEYDRLKSGETRDLRASSLKEVGELLIKGRIASGLSQKELGDRLGVQQQQIQRYESEAYCAANLDRLEAVARALRLNITIQASIEENPIGEIAPNLKSMNIDLNKMPLKEMKKRQWLVPLENVEAAKTSDDKILAAAFLSRAIGKTSHATFFRQNVRANSRVNRHSLFAWQAGVLHKARDKIDSAELISKNLDDHWVKELVALSRVSRGPLEAVKLLQSKGIIVIIEPHLEKTFIDGAAMLVDNKWPVIALTLRHDRLDNFWFVLLHELGHIFLHRNSGLEFGFFDEESSTNRDQREKEADEFAERALIPAEAWNTSFVRFSESVDEIKSFASKYQVGPWIVAGRIRKERNRYHIFADLLGQGEVRKLFPEFS